MSKTTFVHIIAYSFEEAKRMANRTLEFGDNLVDQGAVQFRHNAPESVQPAVLTEENSGIAVASATEDLGGSALPTTSTTEEPQLTGSTFIYMKIGLGLLVLIVGIFLLKTIRGSK